MAIPSVVVLKTKIKFQPNDYYCGAASAQSVLSNRKVKRAQSTLYRRIHKFPTIDRGKKRKKWYSSPDGLANTLNYYRGKFKPGNSGNQKFEVYKTANKVAIARKMIWAINNFSIPCINLIKGGDHWITVYGYKLINPTNARRLPAAAAIEGFYVRDSIKKDTQEILDYNFWKKVYAVRVDKGYWKHKFVAVYDPDPKKKNPGERNSRKKLKQNLQKSIGEKNIATNTPLQDKPEKSLVTPEILHAPVGKPTKVFTTNPVTKKNDVIDDSTAKAYALWWLKPGGFYDKNMFKIYLENPGAANPVLVQDLETEDFYYIVPIKDVNEIVYGLMCIAGSDASHMVTSFSMSYSKYFSFTPLSEIEIQKKIKLKYGIEGERIMSIHPTLVWKYSRESLSIDQPFYLIVMGKLRVYIRIDGKMFTELSNSSR